MAAGRQQVASTKTQDYVVVLDDEYSFGNLLTNETVTTPAQLDLAALVTSSSLPPPPSSRSASVPIEVSRLMSFFDGVGNVEESVGLALEDRDRGDDGPSYFDNLGILYGSATKQGAKALRDDPKVKSVAPVPRGIEPILPEPDEACLEASSLDEEYAWGLKRIRVPELWAKGHKGKGVLVGHLDTGADREHRALKKAIDHFTEFDANGTDVKPRAYRDTAPRGHGTHTAAIIAGRPVNGKHIGVAPEAKLASAIVIEGGRVMVRVLGGMNWAVGRGVKVLSMSLGFKKYNTFFLGITQRIRGLRILPVFAVGNEGAKSSRSPGNYAEALSVGAIDKDDCVPEFSSSERMPSWIVPSLVAPGVKIMSAKPGGDYQELSGTSMATPHVAGLAALLLGAVPTAGVEELEDAIFRSCTPLKGASVDRANRGIPDAVVALKLLQQGPVSSKSKGAKALRVAAKPAQKAAKGAKPARRKTKKPRATVPAKGRKVVQSKRKARAKKSTPKRNAKRKGRA